MPDNELVFEAGGWIEVDDGTGTLKFKAVSFATNQCVLKLVATCDPEAGMSHRYECDSMGCDGDCQLEEVTMPSGEIMRCCTCVQP
jgi:hypothetical protein